MQPYYAQGGITIYHGDCRDVLPTLAADSVGLVLTDPPYGIAKRQRTYAVANGPVAAWDNDFPTDWMVEAARIAPALGVMPGVVNLPRCPLEVGRLRYRWTLAAHVTNGMTRGPLGYGNWIPCAVYAAEGVRLYRQVSDVGRVAVSGPRPDHPSPKPIGAMRWLVQVLPDGAVLDPFMGVGSTLMAARLEGRQAIGIEIEERYCEIAARRLQQQVLPLEMGA